MKIRFTVKDNENQPVEGAKVDIKYGLVDTILLTMKPDKPFRNVEGELTVKYNAGLGNLSGAGGAVESFEKKFAPEGLVQQPNPYAPETITVSQSIDVDFKKVLYNGYGVDQGTIKATTGNIAVDLIHTDIINP